MVEAVLDWLAAQPPALAFAALAALSSLENVFPPLPADVAVVFGAFVAQRARVSPYLLGGVCWLANLASSAGMYAYARARGRRFFDRGWPRRLVPPAAVQALEEAYAHHGVWGIFVSRFFPGVRAAVMPFAGLLGVSPARAVLPAALASAIWYALLVAAGTAVGLNWQAARRLVDGANRLLGASGLLAAALLAYWVWRRSRRPR
jgi:alkaline phosphatase